MADPLERLGLEALGSESNIKDELSMEIDPPFKENTATADDWRKALSKVEERDEGGGGRKLGLGSDGFAGIGIGIKEPTTLQSTHTSLTQSLSHSVTLSHRASAGRAGLPRTCHRLSCESTVVAGASSGNRLFRRLNAVAETAAMDVVELKKGIAELYDESSGLWENIWGDHMHHGYYDPNADVTVSIPDHRAAQIRMIDEVLRFAGISEEPPIRIPKNLVDVGCGIGGSSRYLAGKYGANAKGITLSPVQAERANALAAAQGLANQASFQVADALNQPFPDGEFDLVWSMESGEHMPDKAKFVNELVRVAAPGATIIIVTWCHRDLGASETTLKPDEKRLLDRICSSFYLPAWCSAADYLKLLESHSLEDIKAEDWSPYVAPFWPAVIRSALTWKGFTSLLRTGMKTIRGALVMPLMIQGFKKDLIKYAVITCQKPE